MQKVYPILRGGAKGLDPRFSDFPAPPPSSVINDQSLTSFLSSVRKKIGQKIVSLSYCSSETKIIISLENTKQKTVNQKQYHTKIVLVNGGDLECEYVFGYIVIKVSLCCSDFLLFTKQALQKTKKRQTT